MGGSDGFPWFKVYAADWLHETRFLTSQEKGWIFTLHCECWLSETRGQVCADRNMLWKLAGAENREQFDTKSEEVIKFFIENDGFLVSKYLRNQASVTVHTSKERSKAGKKGAASMRKRYFPTADDKGQSRIEQNQSRTEEEKSNEVDYSNDEGGKQNHAKNTHAEFTPNATVKEFLQTIADRNPWTPIALKLKPMTGAHRFDNFFKPCRFVGVDESVLVLSVPGEHFIEICNSYKLDIQAISHELGMPLSDVRFIART